MKSIDLLKGMNDIDDKYIEEAVSEAAPKPKVSLFRKYYVLAGLAAAACVVALSARAFKVSQTTMESAATADATLKGDALPAPAAENAEAPYEMAEEAAEEAAEESYDMAGEEAVEEEAESAPAAAEDSLYEGAPAAGSEAFKNGTDLRSADVAAESEESAQTANPWRGSSREEIESITGRGFKVPGDAVDEYFLVMNDSLAEMDCAISDKSVTARMEKRTDFADISGANYEWTGEYETKINGHSGKIYIYESEKEHVAVCLFSDGEVMYSLMIMGEGPVDKEELTDLADQIWDL